MVVDPTQVQVELGWTIRRLRGERGYSQEAFADTVGLHRTYMGGIERGERNVGIRNLARIAEALEIPLSELLALVELRIAGREG